LNLQIASFENDASPSKPVLYSNKWFRGDEFRDVLRLLPFKKGDGTFSFDEDALVFKVGGKIYALSSLMHWEKECRLLI
jgi:hypothetical protein